MQAPAAVPLSALYESPLNKRTHFNTKRLLELAQSIRAMKDGGHPYGILEPLLVRPGDKKHPGKWEIIAGHRRLRAALHAKVELAQIAVSNVDDKAVLEMMAIENEQREDLHPLEQAEGYSALIKHGYSVEDLAARIGKELGYVYRRLKLLDLIEALKKDFIAEKFPYVHAVMLARLTPADQERARKDALYQRSGGRFDPVKKRWVDGPPKHVSRDQLESWIRREIYLDLRQAGWSLEDETLVPAAGSCVKCPKRTGANPSLFPEMVGESERCLDGACFKQKERALVKIAVGTTDGPPVLVAFGCYGSGERSGLPKGTLFDEREVDKRCPSSEQAVVVFNGSSNIKSKVGSKILICRDKKCKQHNRSYSSSPVYSPSNDRWHAKRKGEAQARLDLVAGVVGRKDFEVGTRERLWMIEALEPDEDVLKLLGIEPVKSSPKLSVVGQIEVAANTNDSGGKEWFIERALFAALLLKDGGGIQPMTWGPQKGQDTLLLRVAKAAKLNPKQIVKTAVARAIAAIKKPAKKKATAGATKKRAAKGAK